MQLDACLRSIRYAAPYTGPITVIYTTTSEEFADGYRALDLRDDVRLVHQGDDFRGVVMDALDTAIDHVVFHTDDDVFYRRPKAPPLLPAGCAAFSLRLGENTTRCYALGRAQQIPPAARLGPAIAWNWMSAEGDFCYPMSLDGHIFPTRLLVRMLRRAQFDNPNQLEDELHVRRYLAPALMMAYRESCLVSIPANIVTSTHRNRAGGRTDWSPGILNARFLAGERLDLNAMDFSSVSAAHQEIPFAFANRLECDGSRHA
jgi:hypothetical protein